MKHRLLLLLLTFISITAFGQAWQDGGNGVQFRHIGGFREVRQILKTPQPPFAVTDSLTNIKNNLLNKQETNQYSPSANNYYWLQSILNTTNHNRDGAKLGVLGEWMFSFGGWHPDTVPVTDSEVYRFNKQVSSTTRLADAPWAGRHTYGFANTSDAVYVFGGDLNSGVYLPDSWKGTLNADSTINWTLLNSNVPWGERILFGSTYHNGALYVIGGQETSVYSDGVFNDVWKSYDGITWVKIADGLTQFGKNIVGGVVSYAGYIYVIGGGIYDTPLSNGTFENKVYRSRDGITWERLPDAPWNGRQYMDCVVYDGKIFMVGGNTSENTPTDNSNEVWSLDANGYWQKISQGITGRHASAVASYRDRLIVSTGNYWNDTWTLNKYFTSSLSTPNTIPVRDQYGTLNNSIFNAISGGSGGYVIGSTSINPNGDASFYYSTDNMVLASKKAVNIYTSVTPLSTPNIRIDSNGYILMGRGGVLPTLNTNFLLNLSGALKSSGKISWGLGSFVSGESGIYNTVGDGTLLIPKTGTTTDFVLTNGAGSSIFDIPTGTIDANFYGKIKVPVAPSVANDVLRYTDLGTGWGQYTDNSHNSGSPLVINSGVTSTITNNASTSITSQLPIGVTSFYNSGTSKITPQNDGDSYLINVRFTAVSNNNAGLADVAIDIGGAMNIIVQETVSLRKGVGQAQVVNLQFDVFSGATFVSNGGLIKLTSVIGDTSIYNISYKVTRVHKAK